MAALTSNSDTAMPTLSANRTAIDTRIKAMTGIAAVLTFAVLTWFYIGNQSAQPYPDIQGFYIPEAVELPEFALLDHRGNVFDNAALKGRWHLINYGYTSCPDICPTTLATLAKLLTAVNNSDAKDSLKVLFYSIDPDTDTAARLALYVPYFHSDFKGLTAPTNRQESKGFERGLGLNYLKNIDEPESNLPTDSYTFAHGVVLYLLNPSGKLQAVFKPSPNVNDYIGFNESILLQDYRSVRTYVKNQIEP